MRKCVRKCAGEEGYAVDKNGKRKKNKKGQNVRFETLNNKP